MESFLKEKKGLKVYNCKTDFSLQREQLYIVIIYWNDKSVQMPQHLYSTVLELQRSRVLWTTWIVSQRATVGRKNHPKLDRKTLSVGV